MRTKTAILVALLAGLHLVLLFAGFFAPYDPTTQDRELPYAPPTRFHFKDSSGFHLRPFVYAWTSVLGSDQPDSYQESYKEDRSHEYPLHFFVSGPSYKLLGIYETSAHLFGVAEPGKVLLFGTDAYGRDELSRVLVGGQISVAAGITATFIALLAGSILGVIAGYYGRWIDESLMGVTELFLSLPWLYFLLGVRAFLPLHLSTIKTFFLLTGVIGLIGWAGQPDWCEVWYSARATGTTFWPPAASADLIFTFCDATFCPKPLACCLPRRRCSFRGILPPK